MKSNVGRLRALVAVLAVLVSMVLSACGSGGELLRHARRRP